MSSIRIIAAGAAFLLIPSLLSGLTAGSAAAQSGGPLQLLQILQQPSRPTTAAATRPRVRSAAHIKKARHHTFAEVNEPPAQPQAAPATAGLWPADNSVPPIGFAVTESKASSAAAPMEPPIGELVVGGETVKIASEDEVNDIDLAANDGDVQGRRAMLNSAINADDATLPKSDSLRAALALPSPVGSTSWLLQVLAALGGAVAAGSAAWFLIGATPQRTYG